MDNTSKAWREQAVDTYTQAQAIETASPGSIVAVELYARAGAEAAIATAFAVGGNAAVPRKRTPAKGIDKAQTSVVSHHKP